MQGLGPGPPPALRSPVPAAQRTVGAQNAANGLCQRPSRCAFWLSRLGIFDTQHGEYEWTHKPELDTSRRRFHM